MGSTESKPKKSYDDLVCMLDELSYGWETSYECQNRFNIYAIVISNNIVKLAKEKPELITNVVKVYPEVKEYLFEILGYDIFRRFSNQLELYHI